MKAATNTEVDRNNVRAVAAPLERVAYSVPEAAVSVGISRATAWKLVKEGKLAAVKLGGRTLIRREALDALLNSAEAVVTR